jgi:CMP-N-acetylneuraminic acid synthetase
VNATTIAVIPARGGSKSIPRKNLADLGGKPRCGALAPFMRPADIAGDLVPSLPVVQHAVTAMEEKRGAYYDFVVLLQATAPLCRAIDISACLDKLAADAKCASVVAVTSVSTHPFRMKRIVDGDRLINYVDQGFEDMRPRQVLPPVYRRAGSIYASRRHVVMEQATLVGDPCRAVIVPSETAVDIDGPLDLALVRLILGQPAR